LTTCVDHNQSINLNQNLFIWRIAQIMIFVQFVVYLRIYDNKVHVSSSPPSKSALHTMLLSSVGLSSQSFYISVTLHQFTSMKRFANRHRNPAPFLQQSSNFSENIRSSFFYTYLDCWNALPLYVRQSSSLISFNRQINLLDLRKYLKGSATDIN